MSEDRVSQARAIVAGAAHGAWMVALIGAILIGAAWVLILLLKTYAPDTLVMMTGVQLADLWSLTLRYVAAMKLMIWGWVMVGIFLSYWWRALRA